MQRACELNLTKPLSHAATVPSSKTNPSVRSGRERRTAGVQARSVTIHDVPCIQSNTQPPSSDPVLSGAPVAYGRHACLLYTPRIAIAAVRHPEIYQAALIIERSSRWPQPAAPALVRHYMNTSWQPASAAEHIIAAHTQAVGAALQHTARLRTHRGHRLPQREWRTRARC